MSIGGGQAPALTGVLCTVGDGELIQLPTQQEEVVMTSRPVGQERHCFFSYRSHRLSLYSQLYLYARKCSTGRSS